MPYLIHFHNGSAISHIELGEKLTIGRGTGNELQVADATISTEHACIEREQGGGYRIRDMGSTNGVLIKGERITEQLLADGDYVVIGTHEFQFLHTLPEPMQATARIRKSWIPGIYYTTDS